MMPPPVSEIASPAVSALGLKDVRFEYAGGEKEDGLAMCRWCAWTARDQEAGWNAKRTSYQALDKAAKTLARDVNSKVATCP